MLQFLIDWLTPIFEGMGVSPTDVQQYVHDLSGYIYAIFGLTVAMIVIMIAAHWFAKKGTRHVVRWSAGVAWIAIIAVLANIISFGPMYNNLAPILNMDAEVSETSIEASKAIIQETGEEGMALIKNDGTLPFEANSNLNVFGWASTNPIYGGTGSGSADSSTATDILASLDHAGFSVNQDIIDMYTEYKPDRVVGGNVVSVSFTDWSLPEPTVDYYTDELMSNAKDFSEQAMIVISRSGGEGQDVPTDMNAVINGTYDPRDEVANGNEQYNYFACNYDNNGDYDDFDEGESYLELSNTEEAMVEKVCSEFDNVAVVINANNPMELGWVDQYEQIGAVILAPGTGATGMEALGEILNGSVNPSGRTVDTYVYDLTDTPTYNNFGSFLYNNVDDLKAALTEADVAYQGVLPFVNYVEDIYVGYKFYETAAEEGLINYEEKVQFPFGYGLSYTTFSQEMQNFTDNGDTITVDVVVTNTGNVAGKDVVELYVTPPYTDGGIEKASVNLIDFGKTQILEPGASETISFEIAKEDMASYDSKGIKTENGGYILEAGDYIVSARSDSHTVLDSETFHVDADIDYSTQGRPSDGAVAVNQFQDRSTGTVTYLSRANGFANYDAATAAPSDDMYVMDDETRSFIEEKSVAYYDSTKYDNADDVMPTTEADNGVVAADLTGKEYDDPLWDDLLDQLSVDDMINMVNLGGFQTVAVDSIGKVGTQDSDGTSGLNDWYIGVYGTAYSTELLIAQTWNKDLAYRIGETEGQEYADCRIFGTYSPAMNTHRTAFSGRNFEYYSEDGVLAGHMASNTINGLSQKGVYAYIKHFVLNDQETNRCCLLQTYTDEQALREIYMKPFEICVKNFEGQSLAVMSSFNFIGDTWTGADAKLLNNVLRDEWGFQGMVLTDWNGSYGYQNTDDAVRNGNDAMLGFFSADSNQITNTSATMVTAMRQACKNILYTVVNSGNYTIPDPDAGKMSNMTKLFVGIDVAVGVVALAILGIVFGRYFRKKKAIKIDVVEETSEETKAK
ncbi:MAG: glycoside hydrolase family 3 N-terminal domain-containing protein [Lachnospiraceae bacterium]|nr:glycoside hydrolase family 3 N-terminal domain-containing protein [Lachnospiraceae bacterium]MDD3615202.1 glycoside hydrolase family 3 N-terminal domain-containing protein [Lachnospiraceae bacterium]